MSDELNNVLGAREDTDRDKKILSYDETVIREFAQSLYETADRVVAAAAWGGFLGFGALGAVAVKISAVRGEEVTGAAVVIFLFCGVFGALFGASRAEARARQLRLQAQTALCQVQIELNTRRPTRMAPPIPQGPESVPRSPRDPMLR